MAGRIYGYCRVSTKKQSLERQEVNILLKYPEARIYKEKYTGSKMQGRKELEKILKIVKKNDTIVFDSVSRMSRNAEEGVMLYEQLFNRGVNLVFLNEMYVNTDTYKAALSNQFSIVSDTGDTVTDNLVNSIVEALKKYQIELAKKQIFLAFEQSQKERDDLSKQTKEGIRAKKEAAEARGEEFHSGIRKGRHLVTKKSIDAKKGIRKYSRDFDGYLNDADVMKLVGIARNTYYKYKKELSEEISL